MSVPAWAICIEVGAESWNDGAETVGWGWTSARARATGRPITQRKPAATLRTRIQLLFSFCSVWVFMAGGDCIGGA